MLEKQYVTRTEWRKHTQTHPLIAHGIWGKIKNYVPAFGYSQAEINAFFEGEDGGKKQVHWDRVTNKPSSFTPSAHASAHQAGGGDPLNNLLLGASPYIKWQSGNLLFQTDVNDTNTIIDIKGKGTGIGVLGIYDQDNAEYIRWYISNGVGTLEIKGTTPGNLRFMPETAQDIRFWQSIPSGNPYFYRYGYQTGVGVKYGRDWVDTSGIYNIQGQVGLKLNWPSYYADNSFLVANNKVYDSARLNGQLASYYSAVGHNILSADHGDTLAASVVRGDIIIGNATPKWSRLAKGAAGKYLRSNGTDPSWQLIQAADLPVHKTRHQAGGADFIRLDDLAEPEHNLDLNVSESRHGLFPILSGHEAECYAGDGAWLRLYDSTSIIIKILSKVSTTVRNNNDAEQYTTEPTSYIKLKETKLGEPTGPMSIYFEMRTETGGFMAYAKLYKNGVEISGTVHSTANATYQVKTENIGAVDTQDLIQIYGHGTSGERVFIRNMRFRYDRSINMLGDCTLSTPITITTQVPFTMQNQDP